ncbi:boLa class II histocompatibility antigen, DQB*0101 beta chain [Megalops cyprinoides]|uniref:boLa class II histocompatibility antigen, DQB*0101 beta chain n=1 Tax=Megalops cyprinoides TaxID=118141 RepID=UPI001863FFD5|nr:boLa class II histocompatibility antigen, DQB*0101 beta chain [Megalops cyprinoides]
MLIVSLLYLFLFWKEVSPWTDYQTVNILALTRLKNNGLIDQEVVVLVNDAIFAYFDSGNKTFVLRPSASAGFSVLEDSERKFCMDEVLQGFSRQKEYLDKLITETKATKPPKVSPSINVYSQFPVIPGDPIYLYCYATGFYPGDIKMTFLQNRHPFPGEAVTSDLVYGEDWSFRVFKYVAISPLPGEEYSCKVEHSSMKKAKTVIWRPTQQSSLPSWVLVVCEVFGGFAVGIILQRNMIKNYPC